MEIYWRIESTNCHCETRYLQSIRPTTWCILPKNAKRFNDTDVIVACRWLVKIGASFTVRQFSHV